MALRLGVGGSFLVKIVALLSEVRFRRKFEAPCVVGACLLMKVFVNTEYSSMRQVEKVEIIRTIKASHKTIIFNC